MKISTKKQPDTFDVEHDGAVFHCRALSTPEIYNIMFACTLDERTGGPDIGRATEMVAQSAITGWSGIFDEDSGESVEFDSCLIEKLPWPVKAMAADPSFAKWNREMGLDKIREDSLKGGVQVPLAGSAPSGLPSTSNFRKSTAGDGAKGAARNTSKTSGSRHA